MVATAAAAWLVFGYLGWFSQAAPDNAKPQGPGAPSDAPSPRPLSTANASAATEADRLARARAALLAHPSFRGTTPNGEWCVRQETRLQPCEGLRWRFEYYLLGGGLLPNDEIAVIVADEARKAHGDKLAGQIMAIWQRYIALRDHGWRHPFKQDELDTWMPVLAERHAARRQLLGPDWADAFFKEDEAAFKALHARLAAGTAPPRDMGDPVPEPGHGMNAAQAQAIRRSLYGEEAAERLAQVDQDWAAWESKLAAAREEQARLAHAAELSDTQRQQAMLNHIAQHFGPDEQLRARTLLKLPR